YRCKCGAACDLRSVEGGAHRWFYRRDFSAPRKSREYDDSDNQDEQKSDDDALSHDSDCTLTWRGGAFNVPSRARSLLKVTASSQDQNEMSEASIKPSRPPRKKAPVRHSRITEGSPDPLGATWDGLGVNFALFSAHA